MDKLPSHLQKEPVVEAVRAFLWDIIDATADYACAFKPNFAFFERLGPDGWRLLYDTVARIPKGIITVADAKRGDIGNSSRFYAEAIFDSMGFDAVTVSPYMGEDSVLPFLQHPGRAAFVLARTSNPGAADFQERRVGDATLYEEVARKAAAWSASAPGEAGLVVGATSPESLLRLRTLCPTLPFLIPGIGAQGGDIDSIRAVATEDAAVLVNSSRAILYASEGRDFAEGARAAALSARDALNV